MLTCAVSTHLHREIEHIARVNRKLLCVTYIPLTLYSRRGRQRHFIYSSETPTFYQNYLAIKTSRRLIAVYLRWSAINPLVAFYNVR
jgi:hypothetical protein